MEWFFDGGFTFAGRHSSEFGLVFYNVNRTWRPEKNANEFEIPGRDGTVRFEGESYKKRAVVGRVEFYNEDISREAWRQNARRIAQWLSGRGLLTFDDEPDKSYDAEVIGQVDEDMIGSAGMSNITFSCQPFAMSPYITEVGVVTTNAGVMPVTIGGTQETPCVITITNMGPNALSAITIQRKAVL